MTFLYDCNDGGTDLKCEDSSCCLAVSANDKFLFFALGLGNCGWSWGSFLV